MKKILFLTSLSGALEFYDFIIFIFLAKLISQLFFPTHDPISGLLYTFGVFAVGYFSRPIGGLIFGHLGDKKGRKNIFITTVLLMGLPTFAIGLLPTYQSIGLWAPVLLIICRLVQGFALGGEIPGAMTFLVESLPNKGRGLLCGLCLFGINIGLLTGSLICTVILHSQQTWAWRGAFLFGGVLAFLSYYLRKQLLETVLFQQLPQKSMLPLLELVKYQSKSLILGIIITAAIAGSFNVIYLYLPTYLATYYHLPLPQLMTFNTLLIVMFLFINLAISYASDKIGRKKILLTSAILFILFSYPLFMHFTPESLSQNYLIIILCALFSSGLASVFPSFLTELFPTPIRFTAVALCYNIGFGIVGGLTPLLVTYLIEKTQITAAPSFYLILLSGLAAIALLFTRERAHLPLTSTLE